MLDLLIFGMAFNAMIGGRMTLVGAVAAVDHDMPGSARARAVIAAGTGLAWFLLSSIILLDLLFA